MANTAPGGYKATSGGGSSAASNPFGAILQNYGLTPTTQVYDPRKATPAERAAYLQQALASTGKAGDPVLNLQNANAPYRIHTQTTQALLDNLYSLPDIAQFQRQLVAGGYLSSATDVTGVVDSTTIAAYSHLLLDTYTNNLEHIKITPDEVLAKAAATLAAGASGAAGAKIQLMGASDAQGNLTSASQNILGVGSVSQEDVAAYQGAVNAALTGAAGKHSVDPAEIAKQYILTHHGNEAADHSALSYYDVAMSLINGGG